MPKNFYRIGNYNIDHSTFGGRLSLFDFEGYYTLKSMADKIANDLAFDKRCRKNAEIRDAAINKSRRN